MRRQSRWYYSIIACVLLLILAFVMVAWSHGEEAHTQLHTAKQVPAVPTPRPLDPSLRLTWTSTDSTADGQPLYGGTIVTYSKHAVNGRDVLTGRVTWSYIRSDRVVCYVTQELGKTIAVFGHEGNCDEVTALNTARGTRAWERTLDENGYPVLGTPTFVSGPDTLIVLTPTVVYAISISQSDCNPATGANCGDDYWQFPADTGCTVQSAVLGTAGVLLSERCAGENRLILHSRYEGPDATTKATGIVWTIHHESSVPVSAGAIVAAFSPTSGLLTIYDPESGKVVGHIKLTPSPTGTDVRPPIELTDQSILQIAGETYCISIIASDESWSHSFGAMSLASANSQIAFGTYGGKIEQVDLRDGIPLASYDIASTGARQLLRMGSGFVVASPSATSIYQ